MGVAVFLVLFLLEYVTCYNECPPSRAIEPCICEFSDNEIYSYRGIMRCSGITSDEQLESILRESKQYKLAQLTFAFSEFRFLPSAGFIGSQYEDIRIIHSTLGSLTDGEIAFAGLEKTLHILKVENSLYLNTWDWSSLRNLNSLFELFIFNTDLTYIPDSFKNLPYTLEKLVITGNPVDSVADGAFSSFDTIVEISLRGNLIRDLKRNMFPQPAGTLRMLDFSYNKLRTFPRDLFADIPKLRSLDLSGNPIHMLVKESFQSVWKNLEIFIMKDTELHCDCRLVWISKSLNSPAKDQSECQHPDILKGKSLSSLRTRDLHCF